MKTVKEVANALGVSRQAIYKRLSTMPSTMLSIDDKGVKRISDDGQAFLRSELSTKLTTEQSSDSKVDSVVDTVIFMLQKELDAKNAQLATKDEQIDKLTSALEHTTASLHAAQALHAGTMQKQLTDGGGDSAATEPEGFIARLLKKKRSNDNR